MQNLRESKNSISLKTIIIIPDYSISPRKDNKKN